MPAKQTINVTSWLVARFVADVAVEDDRVDEPFGEADGEEADGDQDDAEERVDGGHVRPPRAGLDRVAEHEVGRVEEEEDEEEHELALAPAPPDAPGRPRPDRAGDEREDRRR